MEGNTDEGGLTGNAKRPKYRNANCATDRHRTTQVNKDSHEEWGDLAHMLVRKISDTWLVTKFKQLVEPADENSALSLKTLVEARLAQRSDGVSRQDVISVA
ncbi:hypothetical protein T265_04261 [Opisthorchis viverrini]|uniref:Uncharacterized protein n=1 Tax=Opisthorchis viverrini TaxID=6198 RepID=A0A074ZTB4_OPIVI|nr:hypothetical protein T265_04261 [Opisthorchis viverrini]KER29077.1 hypothetical protein T265_04261 [Opisthorchis viverrini]